MKAVVEQPALLRVLRVADLLISHRFHPLAELILVTVESETRLRVSAAGLGMSVHAWCEIRDGVPGWAIVNRGPFKDWVSLVKGTIVLSKENMSLKAESDRSSAWFRDMVAPSSFPEPHLHEQRLSLSGAEFVRATEKGGFAIARDEARPILTGLLIKSQDDRVVFVSCDGYRLAEASCPLPLPVSKPFSVVVPHIEAVKSLVSLISGNVSMALGDGWVMFRSENTSSGLAGQIEITPLDGVFPDYEPLLPQKFLATATAPLPDLLQAVKIAHAVSGDQDVVELALNPGAGTVIVSAASELDGNGTSLIEVTTHPDGTETFVSVCGAWVIQGLQAIKSAGTDTVVLGYSGPTQPLTLVDEGWRYVIMPRTISPKPG
jgi:DNA polymerase-3 subunit beta